jgi:hypothetical protein
VTIRGALGHDRACHALPEPLHPATRIMCGNEGMIARRSFGTTAIRMRTMTERPLQRDGFIGEVRRTLDESYTCRRGEDQEGISRNSVCPYINRKKA